LVFGFGFLGDFAFLGFEFLVPFDLLAFNFLGFVMDLVAIYLKIIALLRYQIVYMKTRIQMNSFKQE